MTRRNAPTAGLIAAAVATLVWSAWRIVDARLTVGTGIAAWGLWLVLAMAVASAVAYLRELVQQRGSSRRVGWRPVPGVALLWVAGIATVAVFAFLMPGGGGAPAGSQVPVADGSTPAPASPTSSSPVPTTSPTAAGPMISPKAASASAPAAPSQPRAVPVVAAHTAAVTPRPVSTAPAPSAPAPRPTPTATSTSTSRPLVTLPTLPNGKPKPTK